MPKLGERHKPKSIEKMKFAAKMRARKKAWKKQQKKK